MSKIFVKLTQNVTTILKIKFEAPTIPNSSGEYA